MTIWNLLYETSILDYLSYMLALTTFLQNLWKKPAQTFVISDIVTREDGYKTKADEEEICVKKVHR